MAWHCVSRTQCITITTLLGIGFLESQSFKERISNSLYKGFILVNNIHSEIDSGKIPAAYFKICGSDCLLLPQV